MNPVRQITKGLLFLIIVVTFFLVSVIADLIIRDRKTKLITSSQITSFYAKMILIVLGIKVNLKNLDKYTQADQNYMVVSNHLSYVDIFVIYSVLPAVFVANSELEEEFPLGAITAYAGGIFVERRNRSKLLDDMNKITDVLNMGLDIVLFPEATTSNGESVLPFKVPFLKSAINSDKDVLPLCINYRKINGVPVSKENRDFAFYYESIPFFKHFFRLLTLESIDVDIEALEKIEVDPDMTRKELSQIAYERISGFYTSI